MKMDEIKKGERKRDWAIRTGKWIPSEGLESRGVRERVGKGTGKVIQKDVKGAR